MSLLAWGLLPGPATAKGIAWGVVLWLAAQLVVMPMMGARDRDAAVELLRSRFVLAARYDLL